MVLSVLREKFKEKLQENVLFASFTSSRIGGSVEYLIIAETKNELVDIINFAWSNAIPVKVIGGGSNILVSDQGIRNLVVINRTSSHTIFSGPNPFVRADSGLSLHKLTTILAENGLSGLEWASPIPGSVGGALYGNAGAHGSEICKSFKLAEILHPLTGIIQWEAEKMNFAYRSTQLKQENLEAIILSVEFGLQNSTKEKVYEKMKSFSERRRITQPTGYSIGSIFRNPKGDSAGRLIEAAGLKGKSNGGARISSLHANFIINENNATAVDFLNLVQFAQSEVQSKFGVILQPEFELLGEWPAEAQRIFLKAECS